MLFCGLLFWAAAAGGQGILQTTKTLVEFPQERVDIFRWIKANGWKKQRGNPRRFELGEGRLLMVSEADSVSIGTKRGFPIDPRQWPLLRFRVRITAIPTGTDLSRKRRDDSAFRLFIAFDRGKGLLSPPHTIAYSWTENVEPETVIQSAFFRKIRYISIGRGLPAAHKSGEAWITIERDLLQDYRRAFPDDKKPVPNLRAILLKCDSNHTKTSACVEVSKIELLRADR